MRYNLLKILLLILLCLYGCGTNSPIFYRLAENYFPFVIDRSWTYECNDSTTTTVNIITEIMKEGRNALEMRNDSNSEYWNIEDSGLFILAEPIITVYNEDIYLNPHWQLYAELPLINGNIWENTYQEEVNTTQGNVLSRITQKGQISAIEIISVPLGQFTDCYRIEFSRRHYIELLEPNIILQDTLEYWTDWYAPDVGLVKRKTNNNIQELISYQF